MKNQSLDELQVEAIRLSKRLINRLVMMHGYPLEAKSDIRDAHNAILNAEAERRKLLENTTNTWGRDGWEFEKGEGI